MYPLLYLVPKNWLSRSVGWAVRRRWPFGLHIRIRDAFIRRFKVDLSEAEYPLEHYPTLGEFFVRRLRSGARPLGGTSMVSPVDGTLTQRGMLAVAANPTLTQIKGIRYGLMDLIGEGWDASAFVGGAFLTFYLAPWNYHRVHSPVEGRVVRVRHIAGTLWPVNSWSVGSIPDLFVRNDRILVEMECEEGRIIIAMVGATNVGHITLSFCRQFIGNSIPAPGVRDWEPPSELRLVKGGDLGCFEMGSTVVMVLDSAWASRLKNRLRGESPLQMHVGMDLLS